LLEAEPVNKHWLGEIQRCVNKMIEGGMERTVFGAAVSLLQTVAENHVSDINELAQKVYHCVADDKNTNTKLRMWLEDYLSTNLGEVEYA